MDQVLGRTLNLERHVQQNDSEIETLKKDILALKQTVSMQNETISQLQQAHKDTDAHTIQQLSLMKQSLDKQQNTSEQQLSEIKQSMIR